MLFVDKFYNKGGMIVVFAYLVMALIFFSTIQAIIKNIKTKNYLGMLSGLLTIPFQFFFFISLLFGGGALHDAATEYELYQVGHYYLRSHGHWTEVPYWKYVFVLVSEIVGILTFLIAFCLGYVSYFLGKRKH